MAYSIIQPPFTLKFHEMSRQELKDYYRWFMEILPSRIAELEAEVGRSPPHATWRADLSPGSLDSLGEWFCTQVETRPTTQDEAVELASRLTFSIPTPEYELTNRTFSLAMDIGMYFSQVFQKNRPTLRWEQSMAQKKSIDFGQPVLVGLGPGPLNPVHLLVVLAYAIASKTQGGGRLRELYEYWSTRTPRG
jgi:hypothetical protein